MLDARLLFGPDAAVRDTWHLATRHVGRLVVVFDHTDSTNTQALRLSARPDCAGLVILADEQSAGRGQHGRSWLAPPRSSVLTSVLLFPPDPLTRPVLLTALAAVSVCQLVQERTGLPPRIKWPNDILVRDRKICGILIEQGRLKTATAVVIGIGLNVAWSEAEWAAAGLPLATSLHACGDPGADRDAVVRRLIALLDEEYDRLVNQGPAGLESTWRAFLGLVGHDVRVEGHQGSWTGRLTEAGFAAMSLVRPDRSVLHLVPESIRHIERR